MSVAWFIDGSYALKSWQSSGMGSARLDFTKLRRYIERDAGGAIGDAYYFNCESDVHSASQGAFYKAIAMPPPNGAGLRVKLYWLSHKPLYWPPKYGGGAVLHPSISNVQYELTTQKGVDVGLAFHLMRSHGKSDWDKLYLVAGDGDFHEVIQHLVENEGVEVCLIGNSNSISPELAPYAVKLMMFEDIAKDLIL